MRAPALAALGALAAFAAHAAGALAASPCPADPEGFEQVAGERFVVGYRPEPDALVVGQDFELDLRVCTASGAPFEGTVQVDAVMPAHGHGMNYRPSVERAAVLAHGPWPPAPVHDASNAVAADPAAIAFGRSLFHERALSRDGSLACADCHVPGRHYTDGLARGHGRVLLDRNTPTVVDLAGARWLGWGGAHDSLWAQSIRPLVDAREMAGDAAHVRYVVAGDPALACGFERTFGRLPEATPGEQVLVMVGKALAAWQASLVSARTPFDAFRDALAAGDEAAMAAYPPAALRGLKRFVGDGRCHLCHFGPRFTNGEFADAGVAYFIERGRVDRGRYGGIETLRASPYNQLGEHNDDPSRAPGTATRHVALTHRTFGEFKVPSLRGVALTAPYMHDGSIATLDGVVRHYSEIDVERLHADGERVLAPLALDDAERAELVAVAVASALGPAFAPGARAAAEEPVYLHCAVGDTLDVERADAVMVDRDAQRIVWMERRGDGEWRRTTYVIESRTPTELGARAARHGDGEALYLSFDVQAWTFEREWPRPRADNANVWDAHREQLGIPAGVQLYARDAGRCRAADPAGSRGSR